MPSIYTPQMWNPWVHQSLRRVSAVRSESIQMVFRRVRSVAAHIAENLMTYSATKTLLPDSQRDGLRTDRASEPTMEKDSLDGNGSFLKIPRNNQNSSSDSFCHATKLTSHENSLIYSNGLIGKRLRSKVAGDTFDVDQPDDDWTGSPDTGISICSNWLYRSECNAHCHKGSLLTRRPNAAWFLSSFVITCKNWFIFNCHLQRDRLLQLTHSKRNIKNE